MRGYSAESVFSPEEQEVHRIAALIVEAIPESMVRCHELARVMGEVLGLPVVDGKYGWAEHSWLVLAHDRGRPQHLLDVYCVGRVPMVQCVDLHPHLVVREAYAPGETRTDIDEEMMRRVRDSVGQFLNGPARLGILARDAAPLGTGWPKNLLSGARLIGGF